MNMHRRNGLQLLGLAGVMALSGAAIAQEEVVEEEITESRQNIVVERTGQPRIEVKVENGEVRVFVDGELRERSKPSTEWRGTEILNSDGEIVVTIVRDPVTGQISVDGPDMAAGAEVNAPQPNWSQRSVQGQDVDLESLVPRYREALQGQIQAQLRTDGSNSWDFYRPYVQLNADGALPVMMGITMQPVAGALAHHLGLEPDRATVVTSVVPRSPAQASGLIVHDIIVRVNGKEESGPDAIQGVLREKSVGDEVELRVRRGPGDERTITVELAPTEEVQTFYVQPAPRAPQPPARPGMGLESERRFDVLEDEVVIGEEQELLIKQLREAVQRQSERVRTMQNNVNAPNQTYEKRRAIELSLREQVQVLDTMQRELAQVQSEKFTYQLNQLRQEDADVALPGMLIEMMLEEEGRADRRRLLVETPTPAGTRAQSTDREALGLLLQEVRGSAERERERLEEELAASRERERALSSRLERMERQLETLMAAMERMTKSDSRE